MVGKIVPLTADALAQVPSVEPWASPEGSGKERKYIGPTLSPWDKWERERAEADTSNTSPLSQKMKDMKIEPYAACLIPDAGSVPEEYPPPLDMDDNQAPQIETDEFRVAPTPDAGLGAFAMMDLAPGTVILREPAMLIATREVLWDEFNALTHEQKETIERLAVSVGRGLLGIFDTNAFAIPQRYVHLSHSPSLPVSSESSTGQLPIVTKAWYSNEEGLFPTASRFNHACGLAKNVTFRYDTEALCLEMKIADLWVDGQGTQRTDGVRAGEELRICYRSDLGPEGLFERYGFKCQCGGCKGFGEEEQSAYEAGFW